MRIIVFFDLPSVTASDQKAYLYFRKFLITNGFFMLQESVYSKIALNESVVSQVRVKLKDNAPKKGIIQMLVITEREYNKSEYIVGNYKNENLNSDERFVVI